MSYLRYLMSDPFVVAWVALIIGLLIGMIWSAFGKD